MKVPYDEFNFAYILTKANNDKQIEIKGKNVFIKK